MGWELQFKNPRWIHWYIQEEIKYLVLESEEIIHMKSKKLQDGQKNMLFKMDLYLSNLWLIDIVAILCQILEQHIEQDNK